MIIALKVVTFRLTVRLLRDRGVADLPEELLPGEPPYRFMVQGAEAAYDILQSLAAQDPQHYPNFPRTATDDSTRRYLEYAEGMTDAHRHVIAPKAQAKLGSDKVDRAQYSQKYKGYVRRLLGLTAEERRKEQEIARLK
jgi:hypothetical protein